MGDLSAQSLRKAVLDAATEDTTFRDELISQGTKAVKARFGDQSLRVRVHVEDQDEIAILIPQKTEQSVQSVEHIAAKLADRTPTRSEFEALVTRRAWSDPAFLAKLRSNPNAAMTEALDKYKAHLPPEVNVRLYEEQPGECLILVPRTSADEAELSEAELAAAAGGVTSLSSSSMGGNLASKIVDVIRNPTKIS